MVIKTLDELADWAEYRKQTTQSFTSLEAGGSICVSVDDFEFTVNGKPWSGRVVLCGDKGDTSMSALKQKGIQFRVGTATPSADGKKMLVQGLSNGLVTAANKTLAKLTLAFWLQSGVAAPADEKKKDEGEPGGKAEKSKRSSETSEEQEKAGDERSVAKLRKTKAALQARIREALAGPPAGRAIVQKLVRQASAAEKSGEIEAALQALEELATALDRAKDSPDEPDAQNPDNDTAAEIDEDEDDEEEDDDDDADEQDAREEAVARKAALYQEVREAVAADADLRGPLTELVRRADRHEKAGEFVELLAVYDEIEDLLAAEEDDEAAAAAIDITNWKDYRKYLRPRLRLVSTSVGDPSPFWVSRKKVKFTFGDKVIVGRIVLAGARCRPLVLRLKREDKLMFEGAGHLDEGAGAFMVTGIAGGPLKGGGRTLKALRLGYRIAVPDDGEDDATDGEGDLGEGGTGALAAQYAKRRAELAPRLRSALSAGRGDISGLRAADAMADELAGSAAWQRALAVLDRIATLLAAAEGAAPADGAVEPGLVEYRKALVQFAQTRTALRASLGSLRSRIAAIPDQADLADALSERLEEIFTSVGEAVDEAINASRDDRAPATATVRSALTKALADVVGDPLLTHVETNQWGVRIKPPLEQALRTILRAMPAGEAEPAVS